jgi:hypothetical protein
MAYIKKKEGSVCLAKSVEITKDAFPIRSRRRTTEASLYPEQDMTLKKPNKKMDKENRTSLANAKRCSNKISHGYFAPEIARFCGLF